MPNPGQEIVEFTSEEGNARLRLGYEPSIDRDFGTFAISIQADGLTCEWSALSVRGDGLDGFVASLAADWRGWEGVRTWDALERGLSIEATHLGNRVELAFIVRRDYQSDAWCIRLPIRVYPGESLNRLARATADFLRDV